VEAPSFLLARLIHSYLESISFSEISLFFVNNKKYRVLISGLFPHVRSKQSIALWISTWSTNWLWFDRASLWLASCGALWSTAFDHTLWWWNRVWITASAIWFWDRT
jgi:hypothetical protein